MCNLKCWIDKKVFRDIMAFSNSKHPRETGGELIGYRLTDQIIITNATGPGPKADHNYLNFEMDHDYNEKIRNEIFDETDGRLRFMGDWHTHPNGPCDYSQLDYAALKKIAIDSRSLTPNPIMLIAGGVCTQFKLWEFNDNGVLDIPFTPFDFNREWAYA